MLSEFGVVVSGAKDSYYIFRGIVPTVGQGAEELIDWKSKIKFGVLDAIGSSKDFLTKGFHMHFNELKNLELSLQFAEKEGGAGQLMLGFISGDQLSVAKAVKTFNQAMGNKKFVRVLIVRLKAAEETLTSAGKVFKNSNEIKMAIDKAAEIGRTLNLSKRIICIDGFSLNSLSLDMDLYLKP